MIVVASKYNSFFFPHMTIRKKSYESPIQSKKLDVLKEPIKYRVCRSHLVHPVERQNLFSLYLNEICISWKGSALKKYISFFFSYSFFCCKTRWNEVFCLPSFLSGLFRLRRMYGGFSLTVLSIHSQLVDPVANPEAIVEFGNARFTVLTPYVCSWGLK